MLKSMCNADLAVHRRPAAADLYRERTLALTAVKFATQNGWKPKFNKFTRRHFEWSRNGVRFGVSWEGAFSGPWFHVRNEGTSSEQLAIQLLRLYLTEVRA